MGSTINTVGAVVHVDCGEGNKGLGNRRCGGKYNPRGDCSTTSMAQARSLKLFANAAQGAGIGAVGGANSGLKQRFLPWGSVRIVRYWHRAGQLLRVLTNT
jgi:hypothetical protein